MRPSCACESSRLVPPFSVDADDGRIRRQAKATARSDRSIWVSNMAGNSRIAPQRVQAGRKQARRWGPVLAVCRYVVRRAARSWSAIVATTCGSARFRGRRHHGVERMTNRAAEISAPSAHSAASPNARMIACPARKHPLARAGSKGNREARLVGHQVEDASGPLIGALSIGRRRRTTVSMGATSGVAHRVAASNRRPQSREGGVAGKI